MTQLLFNGQYAAFGLIMIALIMSLSLHEFGHAATAYLFGDDTAKRMGRMTVNPIAHIDLMGMLMVVFVGFGYAKPVPVNPSNFNSRWAELLVSAMGPGANLILAVISINIYVLGLKTGIGLFEGSGAQFFFVYLAKINLLLMLFNLIPLGPLDGHYILPYFLSRNMAWRYREFNARYGTLALMGLILLSVMGLPIFSFVWSIGDFILPAIVFV